MSAQTPPPQSSTPTIPTGIEFSSSFAPGTDQQSLTGADADADADPVLPIPLTASLLLTSLPADATTALALATAPPPPTDKVTIRFKSIGNAPILKRQVFKISSGAKFGKVVAFLRKQLGMDGVGGEGVGGEGGGGGGGEAMKGEGLWCYVNQSFAPGWMLRWGCFKIDDQLVVNYCKSVAFG
ncbi:hypothetical protein BDZ91DRAFT_708797 [Kalaharituber pfeilii]|nr:hypothetical protein BDZ91DRAFT_708797 [Kalaharituber pfeilii]